MFHGADIRFKVCKKKMASRFFPFSVRQFHRDCTKHLFAIVIFSKYLVMEPIVLVDPGLKLTESDNNLYVVLLCDGQYYGKIISWEAIHCHSSGHDLPLCLVKKQENYVFSRLGGKVATRILSISTAA